MSELVLRNTRRFFFYHLLVVREANPTLSAIVGFERFATLLVHAGYYRSANLVRRAWAIAFGEPAGAHFGTIWDRPIEELLASAPGHVSINRRDLIRF